MNKLGMTEEQMIEEVEFMREWEKYLMKSLGTEHYEMLCQDFARKKSADKLRMLGASEEEIAVISEKIDEEMGWSTEKQ